jgi:NADPH-dependent curcumin reductase CurA
MSCLISVATAIGKQLATILINMVIDTRSYVPPVQIGEIMRGSVIGIITASKSSKFPVGSYALGTALGWTEYAVAKAKQLEKIDVPSNGKLTDSLGVLGKLHPTL